VALGRINEVRIRVFMGKNEENEGHIQSKTVENSRLNSHGLLGIFSMIAIEHYSSFLSV